MRISDWSSDVCSSDLITDEADAVVLPYRDIVNSGSALLALSRFRPVIAPRLGSLIELQGQVGEDWLWLYDGPLTGERMREGIEWVRNTQRISPPDLSAQDWTHIGEKLARFLRQIDRKSTRLNFSPYCASRMPTSA